MEQRGGNNYGKRQEGGVKGAVDSLIQIDLLIFVFNL